MAFTGLNETTFHLDMTSLTSVQNVSTKVEDENSKSAAFANKMLPFHFYLYIFCFYMTARAFLSQ